MLLPVACGRSDRPDFQAIWKSILAQKGSALTQQVGSIAWIEASTLALGPYSVWCYNAQLSNQFAPQTMGPFLSRWEAIFNLQPLPTDDLQTRRNRIAGKYAILNVMPTKTALQTMFDLSIPQTFVGIIDTDPTTAIAGYASAPGSSTPGAAVTGGPSDIVSANWFSNTANIFVELHKPDAMTDLQFYNQNAYQVYPALANYLPATVKFEWIYNSFSMSTVGHRGTITGTAGTFVLSGTNTTWNTPSSSGRYHIHDWESGNGSYVEAFDDDGVWHRLVVVSRVSDTELSVSESSTGFVALSGNFTNQPYWIQGFFCDCSATAYPYPPTGSKNADNSGLAP